LTREIENESFEKIVKLCFYVYANLLVSYPIDLSYQFLKKIYSYEI